MTRGGGGHHPLKRTPSPHRRRRQEAHLHRRFAGVRRTAAHELDCGDPERPDVDSDAVPAIRTRYEHHPPYEEGVSPARHTRRVWVSPAALLEDLRRHPLRRADECATCRAARPVRCSRRQCVCFKTQNTDSSNTATTTTRSRPVLDEGSGEREVADAHGAAIAHKDVRALEVAVDHVVRVQVRKPTCEQSRRGVDSAATRLPTQVHRNNLTTRAHVSRRRARRATSTLRSRWGTWRA